MTDDDDRTRLPSEAVAYYGTGYEHARLLEGGSRLEFARTRRLLQRFLPPTPARILDVGGGPGRYAAWLAATGYAVHLIDAVPLHVEQATAASAAQPRHPFTAEVGDARALPVADASVDAVLLLGPLYHLIARADRVHALAEAYRVVRPGGVMLAAAISRFASLIDGLKYGLFDDPDFVQIVGRDPREGQHRNPNDHHRYFTTAYFHLPDELAAETEEAGFTFDHLLTVEGPGAMLADLGDWWENEQRRDLLLDLIATVEAEPSLLGLGSHLMAIGRRPNR